MSSPPTRIPYLRFAHICLPPLSATGLYLLNIGLFLSFAPADPAVSGMTAADLDAAAALAELVLGLGGGAREEEEQEEEEEEGQQAAGGATLEQFSATWAPSLTDLAAAAAAVMAADDGHAKKQVRRYASCARSGSENGRQPALVAYTFTALTNTRRRVDKRRGTWL